MNPTVVIVTMVRKGRNVWMVRCVVPPADQFAAGSLQMIPVLGARQDWLGDNVLCDVQLKAAYQREDAAHVTLVDVNFLKLHVRTEHVRRSVDSVLQAQVVVARVHTLTPAKM